MKIDRYNLFVEGLNRDNITIMDISDNDKVIAIDIVAKQFSEHISYDESIEYLNESVNWSISKVAKTDDNIIGVLLLGESLINELMDNDTYVELLKVNLLGKGLEGVALVVTQEFRNKGNFIVYKLIQSIMNIGYDFITIQQYDNMENTMNYSNKTEKIGTFTEYESQVSVFYAPLK